MLAHSAQPHRSQRPNNHLYLLGSVENSPLVLYGKNGRNSKKISKGIETTPEGGTTRFTENTDTEVRMTIKMDLGSGSQKASFNSETVEKFVGKE